jgi:O-6-methylguanine DNA methyltransferase
MTAPRSALSPFVRRVLIAVSRVPPGRAATYGDIARIAGRPRAARAVGRIMSTAAKPGLPYHRIVAAGGRIGGYGGRIQMKIALLVAEGLTVRRGRIVKFEDVRWKGKQETGDRPTSTATRFFRGAPGLQTRGRATSRGSPRA